MKQRLKLVGQVGAVALLGACAAGPPATEFTAADRAAIESTTSAALEIANTTADWQQYVDQYYAEDATVYMDGAATVSGRPAIVEMFKPFTGIRDMKLDAVKIEGQGDLAYVSGLASFVATMADGQAVTERYRYVEVWKRQADGGWKVVHDISNRDVAAQ